MKMIGIVIACFVMGFINGAIFDIDDWEFWFIAIGWGVYLGLDYIDAD